MTEPVLVGGAAFEALLGAIDVNQSLKDHSHEAINATSVAKRDKAIKKIKYLAGLQKMGTTPDKAYVIRNVPVVPPITRPVMIQGGGRLEFSDVNQLYRDHMLVNNSMKELKGVLPDEALVGERREMYNGLKAVVGVGDPISGASRGRNLKGLLVQIAGSGSPKGGLFHSKILSKKQDFSGRGTIYAEPRLGFNEMAIPKDTLWSMYKFHIIRDMARQGHSYINAEKAYNERNDSATTSFGKIIKEVPILANRNPTLMKSNISGFFPVPVEGNSIGVNPLHLPMFAGDYDGDALSLFLPMGPAAVKEARDKLMPSKQIYDARMGFGESLIAPGHEAILGSVHLTEPDKDKKPQHFATEEHVLQALKDGTVDENTPITIGHR